MNIESKFEELLKTLTESYEVGEMELLAYQFISRLSETFLCMEANSAILEILKLDRLLISLNNKHEDL